MTLPTIKFGTVDHPDGLDHYAEVTPTGMTSPIRFYSETKDDALDEAWSYLDEHDRARREQERDTPSGAKELTISVLTGIVENMSEEIDVLMKSIEFINAEIDELERQCH